MSMEEQILEALPIPKDFCCPITHDVMEDPVVIADGHTFERSAIGEWFRRQDEVATSPLTNLELPHRLMVPNHALKKAIDAWRSERPEIARKKISDEDLQLAIRTREEDLAGKSAGTSVADEVARLSNENERLRNGNERLRNQVEQDARMFNENQNIKLRRAWCNKYRSRILQYISVVDCYELSMEQLDCLDSLCEEAAGELRKFDSDQLHYLDVFWLFRAAYVLLRCRADRTFLKRGWKDEAIRFASSQDAKYYVNRHESYFPILHLMTHAHRRGSYSCLQEYHNKLRDDFPDFYNLPHVKKHVDKLWSTFEETSSN